MIFKIIKFNLLSLLLFSISFAEIINTIDINGNKRISDKTIEVFSKITIGEDYDQSQLNIILKDLYETDFFKSVEVKLYKNNVVIDVVENPIIEDVEIIGLKSTELNQALKDLIKLKSRKSYVELDALSDLNLMKNILKKRGYYFSKIVSKIKINEEQNTVRLVYNIDLGNRAKIKKINFIGNDNFKDKNLRAIILSDEHKFWKILSGKVYINEERIERDKRLLLNFYRNNGFFNAEVKNSFVEFENAESFKLTFNINPGKLFQFNDFELNVPNNYKKEHFISLEKIFKNLKNKPYSLLEVEKILNEIEKTALRKNYEFIDVEYEENIIQSNKLNYKINIIEGEKFFIERINIRGNFNTREEVLRNLLIVDEGDPYNKILFNKSIDKIKGTNFFKKVDVVMKEGSEKDFKNIDIIIEEQPTGEISLGAGIGTNGTAITGGISERNFMGKGIRLDTNLSISESSVRGQFVYSKPNFNYTDNTLFTSIKNVSTDNLNDYGYKTNTTGMSVGTSIEQYEGLFFSPEIDLSLESLETNSTASSNLKKQAGDYSDLYFNYSLRYDLRNSSYRPTDGYITNFYQELPISSEGSEMINSIEISKYKKLSESGMIGKISFYTSAVGSINGDDVRISRRVQLPNNKLRGFQKGKIGPLDGLDYVGGNYASALNFQTTLPQIFPSFQSADFSYYIDMANVWGVDYDQSINKSNKIRSSTGISVDLLTPVGPLNFSFSQPLSKASTDKTEKFRFNLGTTF